MPHTKKTFRVLQASALIVILACGVGIGLYLGNDRPTESPKKGRTSEEVELIRNIRKPTAAQLDKVTSSKSEIKDLPPINALEGLNDATSNAKIDIQILDHLFREVQTTFHRLPTGTHNEIVRFLMGENSRSFPYFSSDNPNLNENGEIIDRWGTPYFFHIQSRYEIEIRSAGPDMLHWSDDDVTSPGLSAVLTARHEQ